MSTSTWKHFSVTATVVSLLSLATVNSAQAAVLTFDDLPSSQPAAIPNGYGGFQWTNFGYINGSTVYPGGSGYANGTVSGNYLAFNGGGAPATITRNSAFNFNGAYLVGAWSNNLSITVTGWLGGLQKYSQTMTVGTQQSSWFNFNYTGIDQLKFSASGGQDGNFQSPDRQTHYWGTFFGMDEFNYQVEEPKSQPVPEPATVLGSLVFGALSLVARSQRKQG